MDVAKGMTWKASENQARGGVSWPSWSSRKSSEQEQEQTKQKKEDTLLADDLSSQMPETTATKWVQRIIKLEQNVQFLSRPCPRQLPMPSTVLQMVLFLFRILLKPAADLIPFIVRLPQKSAEWKWARGGRLTGSIAAFAVCHSPLERPLPKIRSSLYDTFKENDATQWGSGKETYAASSYIRDLTVDVIRAFRKQRLAYAKCYGISNALQNFKSFLYRGCEIPVPRGTVQNDPVVEIRHYGLLIDPDAHWRGVSPDGVIFINGLGVGCLEIKCPYKHHKSVYSNIPVYYYDQLMCELYVCRKHWPRIGWLDFVTWTPDGFSVDEFVLDEHYMVDWYLPREVRFFFEAYFPEFAHSERVKFLRHLKETKQTVSNAQMLGAFFRYLKDHCACPAPFEKS